MQEQPRTGGCLCGAVRYEVSGEPYKAGICHCRDCKKVTGTSFLAYADWRPQQFSFSGAVETYDGRSFCPRCGARVFSRSDTQVEIYLGSLDETPTDIGPQMEIWTIRREHWLRALPLPQHERDPA